MCEIDVSLSALTSDLPRLIVEVDTPVLAVRGQPKTVEDDVEHPVSEDCIIFDETHTDWVHLATPTVAVEVEQPEAKRLVEVCGFSGIFGILGVFGGGITGAGANGRGINGGISTQSVDVLVETWLMRLLVREVGETYVIVYGKEETVVVTVNSVCGMVRLGKLPVALGCAS